MDTRGTSAQTPFFQLNCYFHALVSPPTAELGYHLTDRADRLQALWEAARVVRPGGLVFVAAISRFASLLDGLSRGFLFDPRFRSIVEQDLRDGQHRNPDRVPHWFTTAYFHHPAGLREEAALTGLDGLEVVGVEGVAGWVGDIFEGRDDAARRHRSSSRLALPNPNHP